MKHVNDLKEGTYFSASILIAMITTAMVFINYHPSIIEWREAVKNTVGLVGVTIIASIFATLATKKRYFMNWICLLHSIIVSLVFCLNYKTWLINESIGVVGDLIASLTIGALLNNYIFKPFKTSAHR